jgi:hypothetical protein
MANATADPTLTAFMWILLWSSGQWEDRSQPWPDWQRCALRRIVQHGALTESDLDELERICANSCGITYDDGRVIKPVPLSKEHVVIGGGGNVAVSLVKLAALKGVNRVKGDPPLEFGPAPGLTIIFGNNGAGKSGYARVIKKACKARGAAQAIRPNVFDAKERGPATAKIVCLAGAVETPMDWVDGKPTDPRLSNIFVFDSVSARYHVSADEPAVFIPRGLDILPKLAKGCDDLKARFTKHIGDAESDIARVKATWKHRPETKVGELIEGITAQTKEDVFKEMAELGKDEIERLSDLNEALKSDPKAKSAKTTAAAQRVRGFKERCAEYVIALSAAKAKAIETAVAEAKTARAAAKAAAGLKFNEKYLPGTGADLWRELWDIAKNYAALAYPGKEYPGEDAEVRCVLCQQALDAAARARMRRFDDYVRDEARVRAQKANQRLAELLKGINSIAALAPDFAKIKADVGASPDVQRRIQEFSESADSRREKFIKCLEDVAWSEPPTFTESVGHTLENIAIAYEKRAAMELAAHDPANRKELIAERNELADREWLQNALEDVNAQIGRFRLVAAYRECLSQTVTNTITKRSSEIHDILVTKTLCQRFEAEINNLGLNTLAVKMVAGGNKGERKFGIRLINGDGAPLAEIASEGEQRCIALAAFLAELSQASHKSALVFDDPVSSLDHGRRASVARRLCEEATVRQVIVFTHDAVFLEELLDGCKNKGIEPYCSHMSWKGQAPGFSEKGLPWDWQRYKDRLATLQQEQQRIAKNWNPMPSEENIVAMGHIYGRYRETLEKIVQDVVLAGVIARYRSWIRIEELEDVVGFSETEYKEIRRLDKRASDNLIGHDKPAGKQQQVPDPKELKTDIDALFALVEAVKARKAAMKKTGKPLSAPIKGVSQN